MAIRLCVAGATGRMGSLLIREALNRGFEVTGAIAAPDEPSIGRTLRELGVCNLDLKVSPPSMLKEALGRADVYMSFTTPKAELSNLPIVADEGKRIVMGTTGFREAEITQLSEYVSSRVPAVFSTNFSVGINFLAGMLRAIKTLPKEYDVSIFEAHHTGKIDAPSGTALTLAKLISEMRGYSRMVYGREGVSPRKPDEMEVVAVRGGGIPGIHIILIAGPHEMITVEHVAFSRSIFAQGALLAAEWVMKQTKPGIYSMEDVLGETR